jgi:hypothetical protein
MVVACMETPDGKIRVYLHDDQTAQLADENGTMLQGDRQPLYLIGAWLAERGFSGDDLQPA